MADDPRRRRLIDCLRETDVSGSLSLIADDLLAHLDAVDPLRTLLASADQALEFIAKVRYEAHLGRGEWDLAPKRTRQDWISATRATFAPALLLALQQVSNG